MERKRKSYTDEFKLMIVKEYFGTDQSQREILRKYNLPGMSSISRWMRKFGYKSITNAHPKLQFIMPEEKEKSKGKAELEEQLRNLKEMLEFEKLKNQSLTTMIDVAERELKVSIRKKSGPKQ